MSQLVAPDVLSRRSSLLAALRKERASFLAFSRAQYPSEQQGLERLRKALESVTIIVGSARGGTSVFKDALCQAQGVASLPGEHRLLFTLLELCFPDHGGPDERCTRAFLHGHEREFLVENLLYECRGDPEWTDTAPDRERFGHEWALRFRLQWPELDIPLSWIAARVVDAYARLRARTSREDADDLTCSIVESLLAHGLPVNPWYYDLPQPLVAERFPGLEKPRVAPSPDIIEITPYIGLAPCRRPLDPRELVIKASSDPYRLPLLDDLFGAEHVRWIHLKRNPLASINGLLDGWLHHCFWQHDLGDRTAFDRAVEPIRQAQWKFDLPEGWTELACRPLEEIAAAQWCDSHRLLLDGLRGRPRVRSLQFEDYQRGGEGRMAVMSDALEFCGLLSPENLQRTVRPPRVVNQTVAPRVGRWREARPDLSRCLQMPGVRSTAVRLGYDEAGVESWL